LPAAGPRFDVSVGPGGYAWWYIDATSADGQYGLTIIAFIGSVFSPYYKFSGRGDPENHCAINVAFNGPRGGAWAMTERGRKAMARGRDHFAVGPSAMHWGGDTLVIDIAEISAPLPYKVRGQVRVRPEMLGNTAFMLDPAGKHRWHPVAPPARACRGRDEPSRDALERAGLFRFQFRR
jgi:carotenoid 1,2-hydratase